MTTMNHHENCGRCHGVHPDGICPKAAPSPPETPAPEGRKCDCGRHLLYSQRHVFWDEKIHAPSPTSTDPEEILP